jgi:hypothetical protein
MSDADLIARQAELQAAGARMLDTIRPLLSDVGRPLVTGSFVSGLMVWPDLDVMVLAAPDFRPEDVLALLGRALALPGLTAFDYADERGNGPDARYHVVLRVGEWRIDLSLWLEHDHAGVTAYHEGLRSSLSDELRLVILRIKDVWHRRPEYPDEVSGFEIYTAVLDHGVRTPAQFGEWLASRS